ncbi:MAG: CRISPR-associated endonuclease Cas1 [Spirochaetota bacterium]
MLGHVVGTGATSPRTRTAQYRVAEDERAARRVAAGLVAAKIRNQRTMLRRNWKRADDQAHAAALDRLKRLARDRIVAPASEHLEHGELDRRDPDAVCRLVAVHRDPVATEVELACGAPHRAAPQQTPNAIAQFLRGPRFDEHVVADRVVDRVERRGGSVDEHRRGGGKACVRSNEARGPDDQRRDIAVAERGERARVVDDAHHPTRPRFEREPDALARVVIGTDEPDVGDRWVRVLR